jgi:arabinofuranosyltransferase
VGSRSSPRSVRRPQKEPDVLLNRGEVDSGKNRPTSRLDSGRRPEPVASPPPDPAAAPSRRGRDVRRLLKALVLASCLFGATAVVVASGRAAWQGQFTIGGKPFSILFDDAMISMRYAHNLANGDGLVWNPGERVQGFTNLGWVLLMAVPHRLGVPLERASLAVQLFNVALHLAMILFVLTAPWRRGRWIAGAVASLLVASDGSIVTWGLAGLETTCQSLLVTAALLPLLGDAPESDALSPAWAALATIVRPDALLVYVVVLAISLVRSYRSERENRSRRLLLAAASVAAVMALFVFQRAYYGEWLPNTYSLKATLGAAELTRGLSYARLFAFDEFFGVPLLAAPIACFGLRWLRFGPEQAMRVVAVAALPVLWLGYVVSVGGDAFGDGRFFVALIPTMALFAGEVVEGLVAVVAEPRPAQRLPRFAATVALFVLAGGLLRHGWLGLASLPRMGGPEPSGVSSARIADALVRGGLPKHTLIGVFWAGVTPYFMPDYRFHDFLGKTERRIAHTRAHPGPPGHNKWDYDYSLGQVKPDLILTAGPFGFPDELDASRRRTKRTHDDSFHPDLWFDPIFRAEYRMNRLRIESDGIPVESVQWIYAREGASLGELSRNLCR